ncbi:MAG: hypothetical protein HONBIEJF_02679 [Fimbriimonadaceae bacterium]|nr:hypothetical protein [Fimbriimonadaceae bacterium]
MATIDVRVTPRSSSNRVLIDENGLVRVYVVAPPVDGQANLAVEELVAKRLGISKSRVIVSKGQASRNKTLSIDSLTLQEVLDRLADQGKLL